MPRLGAAALGRAQGSERGGRRGRAHVPPRPRAAPPPQALATAPGTPPPLRPPYADVVIAGQRRHRLARPQREHARAEGLGGVAQRLARHGAHGSAGAAAVPGPLDARAARRTADDARSRDPTARRATGGRRNARARLRGRLTRG